MSFESNSTRSSTAVSVSNRVRYAWDLLHSNVNTLFHASDFSGIFEDVRRYQSVYARYSGRDLKDACVLEVGFGQRPFRLFALQSLGVKVIGVDIEQPTLTNWDSIRVAKRHGIYRAIKSLVRLRVFDAKVYREFARQVQAEFGRPLIRDRKCLITDDCASSGFWKRNSGPFDLIYSEDVFEHIPRDHLKAAVEHMASHLSPGGLLLTTPMVYTGICGGHHIEWYSGTFNRSIDRKIPAWDHLLDNSFEADTYLNKLSRHEYRELFARHFNILEESTPLGDLGREFLTDELRQRLRSYSDDELFSNNVSFVLQKKV